MAKLDVDDVDDMDVEQDLQLINDDNEDATSNNGIDITNDSLSFSLLPFHNDVSEECPSYLSTSSSSSSSNVDGHGDENRRGVTAVPSSAVEKSVSFSLSDVQIHEILHHQDMDENEKNKRWYRKKEWKKLRREGRVTTRLLENGELTAISDHEDLGFCTLGLKHERHPYAREEQLHKMLYRDLLMSEQQRQRDEHSYDPDGLALLLIQLQHRCRHTAFISSLRSRKRQLSPDRYSSQF